MLYPESKVYHDGSHYIAIPASTNPCKKRKKPKEELVEVIEETHQEDTEKDIQDEEKASPKECTKEPRKATKSELFNEFWIEAQELPKRSRRKFLTDKMSPYFEDENILKAFISKKIEDKIKAIIARKTRFIRKAYMNEFNYFCTFTYDSKLHDETSFRRKLSESLSRLNTRKNWRYMGVWERGGKTERLHFHALVFVPDGAMVGEFVDSIDYSTKSHKRQFIKQNTYFNSRFGRTDMEEICQHPQVYNRAIAYLLKYIEKTGEKIVYSRGLPMYLISDIDERDVIMRCGLEDKKLLLSDNFTCMNYGEILGVITPETKKLLRTSN